MNYQNKNKTKTFHGVEMDIQELQPILRQCFHLFPFFSLFCKSSHALKFPRSFRK